ncbi:MAG: septum formation protein Maf [Deltaproteobacteria bacterium]|nr:septum formation protein Maf [Deltaproteobacteria bacterium]
MKLVLCSASPRRKKFLSDLGLAFEVVSPDVDEARLAGESPVALAERLARKKVAAGAEAMKGKVDGPFVAIAADTVVAIGEVDLAKPVDHADAARMMRLLSGTLHEVISGVAVMAADGSLRSQAVRTQVKFRALTEAEVWWHARSGDGDDKAGAYALQGLAASFIERLDGSFTNVIGLPLTEAIVLLQAAGVRMPWEA